MKIDKFSPKKAGKICLFFFYHSFFHMHSFPNRARENKAFPPFPLFFPFDNSKGFSFPYFFKALKNTPLLFQKEAPLLFQEEFACIFL
jgi:hypothetical protein